MVVDIKFPFSIPSARYTDKAGGVEKQFAGAPSAPACVCIERSEI
jgi:hypothetical protein